MFASITSGIISASLSLLSKVATQAFFESVMQKVLIYGLEKMAKSTENTLDNDLVKDIKKRLGNVTD